MIIPSRRPTPYRSRPVTAGILDNIAEHAVDEAHWSGTAGRLDSTVEHARAVRAMMPWSANCRTGDPHTHRPGRRPRRRLKPKRTQPSILAEGPARPSSRKTNPRELGMAQSESSRQTVAGQLVRTYRSQGRWVLRGNQWVSTRKPWAGPRGP